MKTAIIVVCIILAIAAIVYWRSRPIKMTGDQFAAMLHDAMSKTDVSGLGRFYFNNGSWRQEKPSLTTPDGKPITVLFDSSDRSKPTQIQLQLVDLAHKLIHKRWEELRREFDAYFKEMDDAATWEQSNKWELNINGVTEPNGWSISFKVPGGHAAWYSKVYQGEEGYSVEATY